MPLKCWSSGMESTRIRDRWRNLFFDEVGLFNLTAARRALLDTREGKPIRKQRGETLCVQREPLRPLSLARSTCTANETESSMPI
jgi:hypothetical protein